MHKIFILHPRWVLQPHFGQDDRDLDNFSFTLPLQRHRIHEAYQDSDFITK